jgi:hypothetical protein
VQGVCDRHKSSSAGNLAGSESESKERVDSSVDKVNKSDRSGSVTGDKWSVKPRVGRMSMDRVSTVSRFEVVKFDGCGNFRL